MSDGGSGPNDREIDDLQVAREEAHRTIDNQIRTLNDIDNKASRILRINLVVISIILTGLSIAANSRPEGADQPMIDSVLVDFLSGYTIGGIVFLILSTAIAAVTYTSSDLRGGMSGRDLRKLLDSDRTDRKNVEGVVESYSHWIDHNFRTNARNAPLGTLTLLLLIYAITSLSLGVKTALTGGVEWWLLGVAILLNLLFTWYTRFHKQAQRGLRVWWRQRTKD